jgi:hypothetical protein
MTTKSFLNLILLAIYINACQPPIEKSGQTEIEKEVEIYIIEKAKPKYYHSIEFGETKEFDLIQLIEEYEIPTIFSDDPKAIKQNKEAFEWLKNFNKESNIAYSMTLIFGMKEKKSDAWGPNWLIVLFNRDKKIIGHFYYSP